MSDKPDETTTVEGTSEQARICDETSANPVTCGEIIIGAIVLSVMAMVAQWL